MPGVGENEAGEGGRGRCTVGLVLLAFSLLASAAAQTPDSLATPDSPVAPDTLVGDTLLTADHRPLLTVAGPEPGRVVSAVPALTSALNAADLLADAPGAFRYDLGLVGGPAGLSVDGHAPNAHALTLGGFPFTDLFSEAPRADLLPMPILDRLRLDEGAYGRPGAIRATLRPFRADAPVTELRYVPGGEGIQYVSASHAQTRRPPRLFRDATGRSRLTVLGHVAGREADGAFAGGALRGVSALGRVTLAHPTTALDLTALHTRQRLGARTGVAPNFPSAFDPFAATVLDAGAERQTIRTDLAFALRRPLVGDAPLTVTLFATRQHQRYTPGSLDTLEVKGNRVGGRLSQPLRAGRHGLTLALAGWRDGATWGRDDPLAAEARTQLHVALRDTVTLGAWRLDAEAGAHAFGETLFPAGHLHLARGEVFAAVQYAGTVPGRVETMGFGSFVDGAAEQSGERTLSGETGAGVRLGALRLAVHAFGSHTTAPRVLAALSDSTAAFLDLDTALQQAGATLSLAWRDAAPRGLYAEAHATTRAVLNPDDSDFHSRLADALPSVWGRARFGFRALALFDGVLDLDLAAQGRAWTAFQSRTFVPSAALFALPDAATAAVPARGTLDLLATARLQRRATLFLVYENALAGTAYDGAFVVPVHPLPATRLRFGVFWTLFG